MREPRTLPILEMSDANTAARDVSLPAEQLGPGTLASEHVSSNSPGDHHNESYTFGTVDHDARGGEPTKKESVESNGAAPTVAVSDKAPPYWGDLPKAPGGGIYNTVTGHGSPKDDHAQHHHLSPRSESARVHVPGHTTDHPRGGIYNTVAGHGSQDEESKRHDMTRTEGTGGHAQQDANALLAAPLPEIPEERGTHRQSDVRVTEPGKPEIARGFLPETAVLDDARLLASSYPGEGSQKPSGLSERHSPVQGRGFYNTAATPDKTSSSPRAFPLVTPQDSGNESSEKDSRSKNDMLLATTAGTAAGAGIAYASKDKPKKLKKRYEGNPSEDETRQGEPEGENFREEIITGSFPHRPKEQRDASSPHRKSREASPHHEKKQHKILGIFHRRKGSKDDDAKDLRRRSEDQENDNLRESHHNKGKSHAMVGATGLSHHDKDDRGMESQSSSFEPTVSHGTSHSSKHMSGNQTAAASVAESAGAFGVLHQKPEKVHEVKDRHQAGMAQPSALPVRSEKRRSFSPPSAVLENEGRDLGGAGHESNNAELQHGHTAKYAGAGAVAGLGASLFASEHARQHQSNSQAPPFEKPRAPPSTPLDPANTASIGGRRRTEDYNALPSGTTSGIKPHSEPASGVRTPAHSTSAGTTSMLGTTGDYNVLPSGTESGVKRDNERDSRGMPVAQDVSTNFQSGNSESGDSTPYNVLPSGTPSGVKVGAKGHHVSDSTRRKDRSHIAHEGGGQYDMLASGALSGIDRSHQESALRQSETERQAAHYTLVAAPMSFPDGQSKSSGVEPESAPHQTTERAYPSAEPAHSMSPEVMPESYRSQSHPVPRDDENGFSGPSNASADRTQPLTNIEPALAAANSAWAAQSGAGPAAVDQAKILHKCQHCGNEDDISSHFTKENMAKISAKRGGAANWWQTAWSGV